MFAIVFAPLIFTGLSILLFMSTIAVLWGFEILDIPAPRLKFYT